MVIAESSFLPAVPGSADPSEWNRTLGQRGANTGSYGFDMPCQPVKCPIIQSQLRVKPVASVDVFLFRTIHELLSLEDDD